MYYNVCHKLRCAQIYLMVKHDFSPFNLKAIPTEMGEQSCKLIEICRVIP